MPEQGKPIRKAQLAVPPEESSSSESEGESDRETDTEKELTATERVTRLYRQERDGSSDEDDIPLMELQKRLRARQDRLREIDNVTNVKNEAEGEITPDSVDENRVTENQAEQTEQLVSSVLGRDIGEQGKVKTLLEAVISLL